MKLLANAFATAAMGAMLLGSVPLSADNHAAPDPIAVVDAEAERTARVAQQLWEFAELGYLESRSSGLMQAELDAGSWKVIGEAREGGNVGLFRSTGEVRSGLVEEILTKIPFEKIIWEAPQKAQQVWFIKLLGTNVNLGNIAPNEVIPLETIRLGLRGDTFNHFLDLENSGL